LFLLSFVYLDTKLIVVGVSTWCRLM